jgi:hypothetical protein
MKRSQLVHFRGVKWLFYFLNHFTHLEITNRFLSISFEKERILLLVLTTFIAENARLIVVVYTGRVKTRRINLSIR